MGQTLCTDLILGQELILSSCVYYAIWMEGSLVKYKQRESAAKVEPGKANSLFSHKINNEEWIAFEWAVKMYVKFFSRGFLENVIVKFKNKNINKSELCLNLS